MNISVTFLDEVWGRTMKQYRFSWSILLPALLCAASDAVGADEKVERAGVFSLVVENDLFANTDRGYTSGQRLSWVTPRLESNSNLADRIRRIPFFAGWQTIRAEYALNQAIFTPADTRRANPDPFDRPYAGWLEASFALIGEGPGYLDQLSVGLGVVGPASLGEASQKLIHIVRRLDIPQGWDFQLRNEPTVQLRFQRTERELLFPTKSRTMVSKSLGFDVMPHYGFALGNAYTYGNVGVTVRFGEDLQDDYGPPRVSPSIPGSSFYTPRDRFGWYVFASTEGRVVARNLFLEGNTFQDSRGVTAVPLVADLQVGAALIWSHARLSYTHVWRTKEFQTQVAGDQFGAISLSVRW